MKEERGAFLRMSSCQSLGNVTWGSGPEALGFCRGEKSRTHAHTHTRFLAIWSMSCDPAFTQQGGHYTHSHTCTYVPPLSLLFFCFSLFLFHFLFHLSHFLICPPLSPSPPLSEIDWSGPEAGGRRRGQRDRGMEKVILRIAYIWEQNNDSCWCQTGAELQACREGEEGVSTTHTHLHSETLKYKSNVWHFQNWRTKSNRETKLCCGPIES